MSLEYTLLPRRKPRLKFFGLLSCMAMVGILVHSAAWAFGPRQMPMAPELPVLSQRDWINSKPLSLQEMRGRAVLVEFWTYGCKNCRRSIAWINNLQRQFAGDLTIISVHTPEFAHERSNANVRRKVEAFGITYPVMLDNDFQAWNAFGNQYWPAFYLVGKDGRLRGAWAGEVLEGSKRAFRIEAAIKAATQSKGR